MGLKKRPLAAPPVTPYNPVVRCHAGKTAGFVLGARALTFPSDSASTAGYGPNGSRTFNPGVVGSARLRRVNPPQAGKNPTRPSKRLF